MTIRFHFLGTNAQEYNVLVACLVFQETVKLFSGMAVPCFVPTSSVRAIQCLHTFFPTFDVSLLFFYFYFLVILIGVK